MPVARVTLIQVASTVEGGALCHSKPRVRSCCRGPDRPQNEIRIPSGRPEHYLQGRGLRPRPHGSNRAGRFCLDRFPPLISGSLPVEVVGWRFWGGTPGGRSPTRVTPQNRQRNSCCRDLRQAFEVGVIRRPSVKARMRALAVVEVQIAADRGTRLGDAVIGPQIVEWRGASQPRALPEPDVNLSIHPAPIIQPLIPWPSVRTGSDCGAEATVTSPRPP